MALVALIRMTTADGLRQPATWLALALGLALLALSWLFGLHTFETQDRLRLLATAGVAVSVLVGSFLGVVLVAQGIHDELADRTALVILSKPLPRGWWLVGKAVGAWLVAAVMILVLAVLHLLLLHHGVAHGFAEGISHKHWNGDDLWLPSGRIAVGHLLAWLQCGCLIAVAAVLALRLPPPGTIIGGALVFLLGHLLPSLGSSGALLLPALDLFNPDDWIQFPGVRFEPLDILGAGLYTAIFCAGSLIIGTAMLDRQDLP